MESEEKPVVNRTIHPCQSSLETYVGSLFPGADFSMPTTADDSLEMSVML